jgi:hypothetical protein
VGVPTEWPPFGGLTLSTVLVGNRKVYGTGHTFNSNDKLKHVNQGARRIVYTPVDSAGKLVQVEGRAVRRGTHTGYTDPGMRNVERIVLVPVGDDTAAVIRGAQTARASLGRGAAATRGAAPLLLSEPAAASALAAIADEELPRGPIAVLDPRLLAVAMQPLRLTCEVAQLQQNILGRWAAQRVQDALFYSSFGAQLLWNWRPISMEAAARPAMFSGVSSSALTRWHRIVTRVAELRDAYAHGVRVQSPPRVLATALVRR